MEQVLTELLVVASFIAFFATACIEAVKKGFPGIPAKSLPLLALVMGVGLGFLAFISFDLDTPLPYMLWGGGIAGFSAVGFFEGFVKPFKSSK